MKYNEKQFFQSNSEAFEVQDMSNGSKIEVHYMNDEPFFNENINKARFSAWASADGKNYKLFVEKGLYDVAHDLFSKEVNEIWMKFWDKVDSMKKKYIFCFMMPMLIVFIAAFILIAMFLKDKTWLLIVALFAALIISMIGSSFLSRNMQKENIKSATEIREYIGLEKFEGIIKAQEKYIEDYYAALQAKYEEEDRLEEERARMEAYGEDANQDNNDEVIDAEITDTNDNVEEVNSTNDQDE